MKGGEIWLTLGLSTRLHKSHPFLVIHWVQTDVRLHSFCPPEENDTEEKKKFHHAPPPPSLFPRTVVLFLDRFGILQSFFFFFLVLVYLFCIFFFSFSGP